MYSNPLLRPAAETMLLVLVTLTTARPFLFSVLGPPIINRRLGRAKHSHQSTRVTDAEIISEDLGGTPDCSNLKLGFVLVIRGYMGRFGQVTDLTWSSHFGPLVDAVSTGCGDQDDDADEEATSQRLINRILRQSGESGAVSKITSGSLLEHLFARVVMIQHPLATFEE